MEENLKQQQSTILKIALFGPESTGKTTLAKQLAAHFDTVWAPEFARDYLQNKFNKSGLVCEPEDLMPIAIGQVKLENDALLTANEYLFCDTTLLVTKVFSEMYYNFCDPILDKAARKHQYDLFFFTDIDVPWQKDDLRDTPNNREAVFQIFQAALDENEKPYLLLSGNQEQRLQKAILAIQNLAKAKEMGFSSHDFVQIEAHNIPLGKIENQLHIFKKGIAKTVLEKPALKGDGILYFTEPEFAEWAHYFDKKKSNFTLKKFVPASGAASRMFKFLNEFLNTFDIENETINAYINKKKANNLSIFLAGLEKFPFFDQAIEKLIITYPNFMKWERDKKIYYFVKFILDAENLDFTNKPKAILPFHKYKTHTATPIEEHLNEGVYYSTSNQISNLHFTISEAHQGQFESILSEVKAKIEAQTKTKINIGFSFQNKATDTIAVDSNNNPFRNENGKLVFRPGGHGALIENLNCLDADIIFIKNIDNVIQNHVEKIALYKKALAGILIQLQEQIFYYLNQIERNLVQEKCMEEIVEFVKNKLNTSVIDDFYKYTFENKISHAKEILNKPIRVCGMVKNEGEPGGGPFWVRDTKGIVSLQIVESTQVDLKNPGQAQILSDASYFNPVDLVCGIKNYKGKNFELSLFVDENSGFIVDKNHNGHEIKGYELPGLWNGAMAKWITVFVQVPLMTFNPVKTVNDLLKSAHQPQ